MEMYTDVLSFDNVPLLLGNLQMYAVVSFPLVIIEIYCAVVMTSLIEVICTNVGYGDRNSTKDS